MASARPSQVGSPPRYTAGRGTVKRDTGKVYIHGCSGASANGHGSLDVPTHARRTTRFEDGESVEPQGLGLNCGGWTIGTGRARSGQHGQPQRPKTHPLASTRRTNLHRVVGLRGLPTTLMKSTRLRLRHYVQRSTGPAQAAFIALRAAVERALTSCTQADRRGSLPGKKIGGGEAKQRLAAQCRQGLEGGELPDLGRC
jgi:hypothetical protein